MDTSKLTLVENWTLKGTWWLVSRSRRKVSGTLIFRVGDGLDLELDGSFVRRTDDPWRDFFDRPAPGRCVILGTTDAGVPVTLLDCFWRSAGTRTTYFANVALVGAHFRTTSAIRFASFTIQHTATTAWAGFNPFGPPSQTKGEDGRYTTSVIHTDPPKIRFDLPRQRASVLIGSELTSVAEWPPAFRMTHRAAIKFYSSRPMTWDTFRRRQGDVDHLMMTLVGGPVYTRKLEADRPTADAGEDDLSMPVRVFFAQIGRLDAEKLFTDDMLFPLPALGDDLPRVAGRWFDTARTLRGMHQVLFGNFRAPARYQESRFFVLAQCLEAFHRKAIERGRGKYLPPRRWRRVLKRMQASLPKRLPKDVAEAAKRKLGEANNFSFQDRLKAIFASLDPATAALITLDVPQFIRAVVGTRNMFTHLDRQKSTKAFPEELWFAACEKMELLLLILMLKLCGLSEERIRDRAPHLRRHHHRPIAFEPALPISD